MNPLYDRIKQNFDKKGLMRTLNAKLVSVEKGQIKMTATMIPINQEKP